MSELTTQKLLLATTCAFGVALVLISFGNYKNAGFKRSDYQPNSISAGKPVETLPPAPAFATTNQGNQAWHSTLPPTQPNFQASYATKQLPERASSKTNPTVVKNFFDSSPLESSKRSRQVAQSPFAQRYAQQSQQRNQTPPSRNQSWPTWRAQNPNQPAGNGYVRQAAATKPVLNDATNVRRADFESSTPNADSSTQRQHNHGGASRLSANPGTTAQIEKRPSKANATPRAIASKPATTEPPVSSAKSVLELETSAADSTPTQIDKRVRKVNWAEIEVVSTPDVKPTGRPLEQLNLPRQRATPQVEAKAREQVRYGQSLARRRAFFASREELIRALLLITSSYRKEASPHAYPECLAQALVALDEASGLMKFTNDANSPLLQQTILSHQTQILSPQDLQAITPMKAIDTYSRFAQAQIERAIGISAAGSEGLHALGRLESMVPEANLTQSRINQTKTLVFYRAAINIDPSNTICANDLGVLLYKMGRLQEAEHAFKVSLSSAQTQLTWNNLALVHNQLAATASSEDEHNRQLSLSNSAAQQAERFANTATNGQSSDDQWATATEFQNNAAFPNVVVQSDGNRPASSNAQPGVSKSAKLKQKLKDWF